MNTDWFGKISKFKAGWITNRPKQKKMLDYTCIFVLVIKPMFWKRMISVFAKKSYKIHQIDLEFFLEFLDEKIYILQKTMFEDGTIRVCFLKKTLYCLKLSLPV